MSPLVTLPHILLVLAGAFLVGVSAYARSHPEAVAEGSEDSQQLMRLAKYASFALVVVLLLVIVALDFGTFRTAKVIQ